MVKYGKFSNSRAYNSDSTIIELIRALVVIHILTKFGDDWLIFVDARVLTSKLWTDGQRRMVSDHSSSLSTPCSGELKRCISLAKMSLELSPLFVHIPFFSVDIYS